MRYDDLVLLAERMFQTAGIVAMVLGALTGFVRYVPERDYHALRTRIARHPARARAARGRGHHCHHQHRAGDPQTRRARHHRRNTNVPQLLTRDGDHRPLALAYTGLARNVSRCARFSLHGRLFLTQRTQRKQSENRARTERRAVPLVASYIRARLHPFFVNRKKREGALRVTGGSS